MELRFEIDKISEVQTQIVNINTFVHGSFCLEAFTEGKEITLYMAELTVNTFNSCC